MSGSAFVYIQQGMGQARREYEWFPVSVGLSSVCVISPLVFNMYIHKSIVRCKR